MTVRGSTRAAITLGLLAASVAACLVHAMSTRRDAGEAHDLTARLGLTDITLFNEARYTRHPALADLHAPFQDGPASLEHFPSGALVSPPRSVAGGRLEVHDR
jgi:hypothetical protein